MNYATDKASGAGLLGGINAIRPPSLEQRLDYLQRALERLMKLRNHFGGIAERVAPDPRTSENSRAAAPPSSDLSGRFGDVISYLHVNLDELEQLANRLEGALFDSKPEAMQQRAPACTEWREPVR